MNKKKDFLLNLDLQKFAGEEDKGITAESLKKLQQDFTKSWGELKGLLDQQTDEIRLHGGTATETASKIKSVEGTIQKLESDLKGVTDQYKNLELKMNRPGFGQTKEDKFMTVGERFTESAQYKEMNQNNLKASQPLQVGSFFKMFKKDLDSQDPNGGILVPPQQLGGVYAPMDQELRMRDLLNVQGTDSNAITFIQETGFVNAAAPTAEKDLKPESDLTFDSQTATVKTIASWLPATRQIISDARQLRNYVDSRLIYGLKLTEENQILYGDNTGENLQGIMTHPGVQTAGAMAGADTRIDHIRRAITLSRLAGYPVTGIVLSPRDFEAIELQKGTEGHYIWVSVPNGGEARLWRVPVVESLAIRENEFLLGAFGLGAQLWDREEANVRVSDHHADFFIRNQMAILAEERITQTIYRPESFVVGTFEATV
jgi:HK97 family phage major capsid protein